MNISHKTLWAIVIVLRVVIIALIFVIVFAGNSNQSAQGGTTANSPSGDLTVSSPQPNGTIGDPAHVTGIVTGAWIQGSFNVEVFVNGLLVGSAPATVQSNSTSSASATFTADIPYSTSFSGKDAQLVFAAGTSQNSTGTPANFSMPVKIQ